MVTGHFGLAAGVKAREWTVPLWALMVATVWLDIAAIPLFATGVEEIEDAPGTNGGYGDVIIYADWTHSLLGAGVIALVTGWIATRWWGRRGGTVVGGVVFSHWILDLIVHRDDMPILAGNAGDLRVGFGLWKTHWGAIVAEAALLAVGSFLYWRAASEAERRAGARARRANVVTAVLLAGGAIVLATDVLIG